MLTFAPGIIRRNIYWLIFNAACIISFAYFSSWFWAPLDYDGTPVGLGDFMAMGVTLFPIGFLSAIVNIAWGVKIFFGKKHESKQGAMTLFLVVLVCWATIITVDYLLRFNYYAP